MNTLQSVLVIIVSLVTLAGVGGALWAIARSSQQDARIKRLQGERDDYLSRLNYIEPRLKAVEQQNEVLLALHNPTDKIEALKAQEQANHDATVDLLQEQSRILRSIDKHLISGGRT